MSKTSPTTIRIEVPCVPIAQPRQRHRMVITKTGKQFTQNYTPRTSPVQSFKATVRMAASDSYSGPPLDGPLGLDVVFILPRPQAKVWKTRPMPRYRHAGKPDLDNLCKSVKDALVNLLWRDDGQVCSCVATKFVAAGDEQPHVEITLNRL